MIIYIYIYILQSNDQLLDLPQPGKKKKNPQRDHAKLLTLTNFMCVQGHSANLWWITIINIWIIKRKLMMFHRKSWSPSVQGVRRKWVLSTYTFFKVSMQHDTWYHTQETN